MIYLRIFWVFFMTNILGYGGGPAIIPLVQHEVVVSFEWLTEAEFTELLAVANAIPGPIAPKMAAFIGFSQGGVLGVIVALLATVAPSLILMVLLMGFLKQHKDSPQVQKLSKYVRPTIAVLMGVITVQSFISGYEVMAIWHLLILGGVSLLCIGKFKIHPVFVVIGALLYGVIFLSY